MLQIRRFPDSTAAATEPGSSRIHWKRSPAARAAAFSVPRLHRARAGVACSRCWEACARSIGPRMVRVELGAAARDRRARWPDRRRLDVVRLQPELVGRCATTSCRFRDLCVRCRPLCHSPPARLLLPLAAPLLGLGIAVSGALYFADRRMKKRGQSFPAASPGLWNVARLLPVPAAYAAALSSLAIALLIVANPFFLPFRVLHPVPATCGCAG